jgi:hypothetical protein
MTRLDALISCAVFGLGAALWGCGSNANSGGAGAPDAGPPGALDLVPKGGAISGWTIDTTNSKTSKLVAATATTQLDTEALIDGASADFFAVPYTPTLFAWQNYVNTTFIPADVSASDPQFPNGAVVSLYVLQMPTADQASGLYASLLSTSMYSGKAWTDPSSPLVGTGSRIADTGDHWWINFYKGNFYVEVNLGPSYSPPPAYTPGNTNLRAAAFAFAAAVASKI